MSGAPESLAERLRRLGVRDEDVEETFVRSGGKGGQNVNKVATCVVLVHRTSGLVIKCQEERSQLLNRRRARELLADKLEARRVAARRAEAARRTKLRGQKRRRSAGGQDRVLAEKRARAVIKKRRGPVRDED